MAIGQQPPPAPGRSGWSRPLFTPDPNAGPDPFEHSYPPWLTTGIVGAITGAIIGGLVVFTVVGNSAVQPIPVAPPTVVAPSSGPIAVATPGVLGPIVQGTIGHFDARGVAFEYPTTWVNMTRVVRAHMPRGRVAWNAILGGGLATFAVVAAYPESDPGTPKARSRVTEAIIQDVGGQLGAPYAGRPNPMGSLAFPAFSYSLNGTPASGGTPYRVDGYVLFGPRTRYVIQCQVEGNDPTDFSRGCAHIAYSMRQTAPPTGAATAIEAARRLFAAWRAGNEPAAHRTASADAVAQLFGVSPTNLEQAPQVCSASGIVDTVACEPAARDAEWLEFLVQRFGDVSIVTQTLWCSTADGFSRCNSLAP